MKTSLFACGFRVTFLAAGLAAVLLILAWAASFTFGMPLGSRWPPTLWHGHEMMFGFVSAAVSGFLLTAVPSWTGQPGFAGRPLVLLATLWSAARVAVYVPVLPAWSIAMIDVSFLPALAVLIAPLLFRAKNRNWALLGVLLALAACNGVFHLALANGDAPTAERALHTAINVMLVLATVIAGRIVPAFTTSALKARGRPAVLPNFPFMDRLTISLMVAIVATDIRWPEGRIAAWLALAASASHLVRLSRWRTLSTWRDPIVWVLHVGYVWIPIGLTLKGVAILTGAAFAAFWLHALTVGALTTLILGVMTRAALGHTGRPVEAAAPTTSAYVLLSAAALVRVFGLAATGSAYPAIILCAALLWAAAFALFLGVYAPILARPRVDGRPG